MTFASEHRHHDIDASDLELPKHDLAEKFGTTIVMLLVIALGVSMVIDQPIGWFLVGVVLFALVVASGLRWAEKIGRN